MKYDGLLHTVELRGAHIDLYKDSAIFHDDETKESWEFMWKEIFRLTKEDHELYNGVL